MNPSDVQEVWQVEVNGKIYEAPFEEMAQWVGDGSLLRQDKVRRGNLRWIEAQKVPALVPFFNAKENDLAPPMVTATSQAEELQDFSVNAENFQQSSTSVSGEFSEFANFTKSLDNLTAEKLLPVKVEKTEFCCLHEEEKAFYLCETCGNSFCKSCPSSYGGNVKICPMCGAMCKPKKEFEDKNEVKPLFQKREKFGFADFSKALVYPFKFGTSLIFGAVMFSIFTIGQSAGSLGGMFMLVAAIFCFMLANMLTFGVLRTTIDNFSQGNLDKNFMPGFDDFSLWDDVVHPLFLSIGVYISSFGVFILVCIIGVYLVFSSISTQTKKVQEDFEKIPGTNVYDMQKTAQQSEEVKKLLESVNLKNAERLNQQNQVANANQAVIIDDGEAEIAQMEQMIQQSRKNQLESVAGPMPEKEQQQYTQMFQGILGLAAPLVVIGFIAFLWGLFYFPAACAVAGYTQSFFSTINPLVGLDTIKTFGFDYLKILLMGLVLMIMSGGISLFAALILSPFDLPKFGNIPATFLSGIIMFYISTVFSCILGYALYKNAGKFKLFKA